MDTPGTYHDMRFATVNGRLITGSVWNPDFISCRPYLGHALSVPTYLAEDDGRYDNKKNAKASDHQADGAMHDQKAEWQYSVANNGCVQDSTRRVGPPEMFSFVVHGKVYDENATLWRTEEPVTAEEAWEQLLELAREQPVRHAVLSGEPPEPWRPQAFIAPRRANKTSAEDLVDETDVLRNYGGLRAALRLEVVGIPSDADTFAMRLGSALHRSPAVLS